MKHLLGLILCALLSVVFGCHSWPKDSYIRKAKSTVNTPWGPSTLEADVVATGKAAANLTAEDKK